MEAQSPICQQLFNDMGVHTFREFGLRAGDMKFDYGELELVLYDDVDGDYNSDKYRDYAYDVADDWLANTFVEWPDPSQDTPEMRADRDRIRRVFYEDAVEFGKDRFG